MSNTNPSSPPQFTADRRARLRQLYLENLPYRVIAHHHGGTADGVRSTIRKMIDRGELPQRGPRRNPYSGQFA